MTRRRTRYLHTHETRLREDSRDHPAGRAGRSACSRWAHICKSRPRSRPALATAKCAAVITAKLGRTDHRTVVSTEGETFECDIDLFDAEKDRFPYRRRILLDTVLCGELIEHLFEDPMHLMSEMNRILKPGGHVVLTTPNIASLRGIAAILQGFHPGFFTPTSSRPPPAKPTRGITASIRRAKFINCWKTRASK